VTNPVAPPPPVSGGDVPPQPDGQGAYPPPGAYPAPGTVPPATEGFGEAPKKSGVSKKLLKVLGVVVVGLVVLGLKFGLAGLLSEKDKLEDAKAGSCLTNNADPKKIDIIDCADAKAAHKVVARVPNVSEKTFAADTDFATCSSYKTAENSLWGGREGSDDGYVLCLEPVKK
jgi:hypothetical protein